MKHTLRIRGSLPFVLGHKVHGQHVLPGLAYIDLLYQFARKQGFDHRGIEWRDLVIHQPVVVAPGDELQAHIELTDAGADRWKLTMHGPPPPASASGKSALYLTAELRRTAVTFDQRLDVQRSIREAAQQIDADDVYAEYRRHGLAHEDCMRVAGVLHIGVEEVLAQCTLSPQAVSIAGDVLFHPALLDGAAACIEGALSVSESAETRRMYLPLCFESFRASELLTRDCIVRVRRAEVKRGPELKHQTLEFFDSAGRKVAELKNFVTKLLRVELPDVEPPAPVTDRDSHISDGSIALPTADRLQKFVRRLFADVLGCTVHQVDPTAGYFELGIKSATLLELVAKLEHELGASLPPTLLFEYPTVAQLAVHLAEQYAERRESASAESVASATIRESDAEVRVRQGDSGCGADIAIVGMAGRFAGASDLHAFWSHLCAGTDCISEIPAARWEWRKFSALRSPSDKPMSRWGGFLDSVDEFDGDFFRISAREAELLDPQERLFLQSCWEAIEDAGYTPASLVDGRGQFKRRRAGVFVGVMHKDYALLAQDGALLGDAFPLPQSNASIANRVSYCCNFHGPSVVIDTACSSSLTAVHMAVQSLRCGDCEVALAGGVNLSLHPGKYLCYGMMDMHSSDGRCRAFGEGGDGYVSGEGVGAVLLKPLHAAVSDGDHIYGVIKASAIGHVGAVSGFTVPSPVAQADVIASCFERAGVDPRTIGYVEAHGTGTSLGDPIEMDGLIKAIREHTSDVRFCAIGSVKSNIGHCEGAAGIAGLIKVALQLHHRMLVPSLHADPVNPHIDWQNSPFYVQQKTTSWEPVSLNADPLVTYPRRASLSSFGATGSNAHVIVEEYREPQFSSPATANTFIVPLSARNATALRAYAQRLLTFVSEPQQRAQLSLANLAHTLQVGRESMASRAAFVVRDLDELQRALCDFLTPASNAEESIPSTILADALNVSRAADEAFSELAREWIRKGEFEKVAELWVRGFRVEWATMFDRSNLRRLALPTYPFARERRWLTGESGRVEPTVTTSSVEEDFDAPAGGLAIEFVTSWLARALKAVPTRILPRTSLAELGVDSIVCVRLARALSERFNASLTVRALMERATIAEIANLVENARATSDAPRGVEQALVKAQVDSVDALATLERFKSGSLSREELERLMDTGVLA